MKFSQYSRKINTFGNSLEKMLMADFPDQADLLDRVDRLLVSIQLAITTAFIEKGGEDDG